MWAGGSPRALQQQWAQGRETCAWYMQQASSFLPIYHARPVAATCSLRLSNPMSQWPDFVAVLLAVTQLEVALLAICVALRVGNITASTSPILLLWLTRLNLLCCFRRHSGIIKRRLVGGADLHGYTTLWWHRVGVRPGCPPRRDPAWEAAINSRIRNV